MVDRTVLQYQIIEKIGVGGRGEIYKARDTRLNRFVAMKVLSAGMSADPDRRMRFVQEAQAVSALNHPNIITIYDVIDDGGTQFMVVEYVDGKTLLELIPEGGMPIPQVIKYATQVADALTAAHAAGIIHRDLKPANIMITGNGWVKVLDFGLAKLIDWAQTDPEGATVTLMPAPMTIEGTLLGTVNYMSPEQAEGKKVDARSDIFSFGAVVYEMATGQAAFRGDSVVSTLSAVLRDEVKPLRELVPEAPAELERIIGECLKKDPEQRVQSMAEVEAALATLRQQVDSGILLSTAGPASGIRAAQTAPPLKKRRSGVAIFVLLLVGSGFWMWNQRQKPVPRSLRPQQASSAGSSGSSSAAYSSTQTPVPRTHTGTLSNADIIAMQAAQISPQLMIDEIHASKTNFDLSAAEVIRLTKAGVPATVIAAMHDPGTTPTQTTAAADVTLNDGLAIHLALAEDIPADAAVGDLVRFKVTRDVRVDDMVAIRKGAGAIGTIMDSPKKRLLGLGNKQMTFRLDRVDAAEGQKVAIRVTPLKKDNTPSKRPVDVGVKKSPDVASSEGTPYLGYVDGTKTISVRK